MVVVGNAKHDRLLTAPAPESAQMLDGLHLCQAQETFERDDVVIAFDPHVYCSLPCTSKLLMRHMLAGYSRTNAGYTKSTDFRPHHAPGH